MNLRFLFEAAVAELRIRNLSFAVAGGFAADLYRREPRLTMDVDLVLLAAPGEVETARSVLKVIGLRGSVIREADLAGGPMFAIRKKTSSPCIVAGRSPDQPEGAGVDLLLPGLPWVADAVRRAQGNPVDFGFGALPALTLEDVMISKLWALRASPPRAKDLDDLQSILAAGHELDAAYLFGQATRFKITVPPAAEPFLPAAFLRLLRDGTPPSG